jgi:hypothetical protein
MNDIYATGRRCATPARCTICETPLAASPSPFGRSDGYCTVCVTLFGGREGPRAPATDRPGSFLRRPRRLPWTREPTWGASASGAQTA